MSYDLYLRDPVTNATIHFSEPHDVQGGTYALCGTTEAWLNITYNYSQHFRQVFGPDGIRFLYGLSGAESIPVLQAAIDWLEDDEEEDYWRATSGNARRALVGLLRLARLAPHGVWDGD